MQKHIVRLVIVALLLSQWVITHKSIAQIRRGMWMGQEVDYYAEYVHVKPRSDVSRPHLDSMFTSLNLTLPQRFDGSGWGLIKLSAETDIFSTIDQLKGRDEITNAVPVLVHQLDSPPNDQFFGYQWGLHNTGQQDAYGTPDADIDMPEAWDIEIGDDGILIGVLDTGIPLDANGSLNHGDIDEQGRILTGPDFVYNAVPPPQCPEFNPTVKDENGHGTHVAGIIGAETNNFYGIAGIAHGCKLIAIQAFDQCGGGNSAYFSNAVHWAVDNGVDIINYSAGSPSGNAAMEDAVIYAAQHNVLIVASAGNNCGPLRYPAAYSSTYANVISVGASDHHDVRSVYSSFGPQLDLLAPGGNVITCGSTEPFDGHDVYSTLPPYQYFIQNNRPELGLNYGYLVGTSMSAPFVSGVAGLVASHTLGLSSGDMKDILRFTADKVSGMGGSFRTDYYGYGRLNAYDALSAKDDVPTQPLNVAVIAVYNPSYGQLHPRVSWTANLEYDIKKYVVYRRIGAGSWSAVAGVYQPGTQWEDVTIIVGKPSIGNVYYYVKAVDVYNNESPQSNTVQIYHSGINPSKTVVVEGDGSTEQFLCENFPNPFNATTLIRYQIPSDSWVRLTVYNLLGEELETLVDEYQAAGPRSVAFSAEMHPSGIYVYKLHTDTHVKTGRLVLIR